MRGLICVFGGWGGRWRYSECSHVVGRCPSSLKGITPMRATVNPSGVLMCVDGSSRQEGWGHGPLSWSQLFCPTPPSCVCNSVLIARGLVVIGVRWWGGGMFTWGDPTLHVAMGKSCPALDGARLLVGAAPTCWFPRWDFGGIILWFVFGSCARKSRYMSTYL